MTDATHQGDGQISRVNNLALRQEVGERLRYSLDLDIGEMPLHLLLLMERLSDAVYDRTKGVERLHPDAERGSTFTAASASARKSSCFPIAPTSQQSRQRWQRIASR